MGSYSGTVTVTVVRGGEDVELEVDVHGSYDPGRRFGPPESCYPASHEVVVDAVRCGGVPWDGELDPNELAEAEDDLLECEADTAAAQREDYWEYRRELEEDRWVRRMS